MWLDGRNAYRAAPWAERLPRPECRDRTCGRWKRSCGGPIEVEATAKVATVTPVGGHELEVLRAVHLDDRAVQPAAGIAGVLVEHFRPDDFTDLRGGLLGGEIAPEVESLRGRGPAHLLKRGVGEVVQGQRQALGQGG